MGIFGGSQIMVILPISLVNLIVIELNNVYDYDNEWKFDVNVKSWEKMKMASYEIMMKMVEWTT